MSLKATEQEYIKFKYGDLLFTVIPLPKKKKFRDNNIYIILAILEYN